MELFYQQEETGTCTNASFADSTIHYQQQASFPLGISSSDYVQEEYLSIWKIMNIYLWVLCLFLFLKQGVNRVSLMA